MKTKFLIVLVMGMLLLSIGTGLSTASAAQWPNLPTSTVQLKVVDGTNSYFIATLSDVPDGYSVHNGIYRAWCIDRTETMVRDVNHGVTLYSSIPTPPILSNIQWGAINYILNHPQGSMLDVQNAIWHFTNQDADLTEATQNMITAAQANLGYDPLTMGGTVLAVICYDSNPNNGVQNTIIELRKPCIAGLSPGFWKHNIGVALELNPGSYSSPYQGAQKLTEQDLLNYLDETDFGTLEEAYADLTAQGKGSAAIRLAACNQFNAAAGFQPYSG